METHTEEFLARALRMQSFVLLAAGALLFSPFLMMLVVMLGVNVSPSFPRPPAVLFGVLFAVGMSSLFVPMLTIPGLGLWISKRTGDRDGSVLFFKLSFIRYAPVLIIGAIQSIYAGRNDAFSVTAVYALGLMVYAAVLLVRDKRLMR